jgi:eukaryotic-like serine/threonine-protein kinase
MIDWSSNRRWAITSGPTTESFPSLSPDGRTLAFTSGELGHDIIEVPLNGSAPRDVIATARRETAAAWAPDGLHFAYATDRSGSPEIWLRNRTDGSERRIVASANLPEATQLVDCAISPDGTRLAYRVRRKPDWYSIWLSPLTGGVPEPLWSDQARSPQRGPSWSPDGTWVAYYGIHDSKPAVMKARVGAHAPAEFIATIATYHPVRWSPRRDWIAFRDGHTLKVVSPDGRHPRVISQRAWETYGWSKDGTALYGIASDANRRLVLTRIDVDTALEHQIADLGTTPPAFDLAENFNEFPYRGFSLHPDGTSFLTSVLRAKMQIYLMKDFDRGGRLGERWWRRQ